jgi:signal transduction histidine kinase
MSGNRAVERPFGYTAEETIGCSSELIHPPDRHLEGVLAATLTLARRMLGADGSVLWRSDPRRPWRRLNRHVGLTDAAAAFVMDLARVSEPQSDGVRVVPDAADLARANGLCAGAGVHSTLTVPLRIEGDAHGALAFVFACRREFQDRETQAALAVGDLVSAALARRGADDGPQRSRIQTAFLAQAGVLLASSFDAADTLGRVAVLAVPDIADWCEFDIVGEADEIVLLSVAHVDPEKATQARRLRLRYPPDPCGSHAISHVVRTGAPVLFSEISDEMLADAAVSREHLEALRSLGIRSSLCVPLAAHGRILGALTLAADASGRRFTTGDLRFAEEFASRVAVAVDASRAYEEAKRANRVKDEFLSSLSHEIRTPLNAILGYARMLASGSVAADRQARVYKVLDRNAVQLSQIVEDVLDVSRMVSGTMRLRVEPVDLFRLVHQSLEAVKPAADAKGVSVGVCAEGQAVAVVGDRVRLRQIVWNLLSNAVKFTPRGGRVDVRLRRCDAAVQIEVADTGIGIAPSFLPHVFERFRQADARYAREFGGLGLGLAVARHLVELHGGTITAASEGSGRGATFLVVLPIPVAASPTRDGPPLRADAPDAPPHGSALPRRGPAGEAGQPIGSQKDVFTTK